MPAYQMNAFEIDMMNGMFTLFGATGDIPPALACAAGSMGNAMGVCVEMMETAARTHHPVNLRFSRAQVFKIGGPLLGLPNNDFVNLAVAFGMMGLSVAGLSAAVTVGTPAAIFLGALCLFGDALGFGAAQHNLENGIHQGEEAAMIGNRRRIQMYLDVEFQKEQGRRPSGRRSVFH